MKETRTINLNGLVFHIDNDAYVALSGYLQDIELRLPADENGDTGLTLIGGTLTDAQGTNPNPLMQVYDIAAPIVKDAKKIPATILYPTRLYDIATTTGETVELKAR